MKDLNDLVTIQDIAKKANTSIGTIDRVIHNRPGVAEKTRQRVLEILKEYNYKPNLIARRLAGTKIFKIAALTPAPSVAFWKIHPEGIKKASEEIKPFGVDVDIFTFDLNSKEEYADNLATIKEKGYDGILALPIYYEEIMAFLKETKIVSVFFDTNIEAGENINTCYIGENAYQTGMVGGKLLSGGIQAGDSLLIIAVGNKANTHLLWIEREIGVKDFFKNEESYSQREIPEIIKIELPELDDKIIEKEVVKVFNEHPEITRVFINSCRATSLCAPYLEREKQKNKNLRIVGYDLTDENISYLKNGTIDYLLNKHPREQCYHGLKMLYEYLVLKIPIPEKTYMPIDIIVKENVDYYRMLHINK
jgi:LacI family transcriptional regulator